MTLHLTYTYLWVTLGIVWFVGVAIGNVALSIAEIWWWERLIVFLWPVAVPLLLVYSLLRLVFWPDF